MPPSKSPCHPHCGCEHHAGCCLTCPLIVCRHDPNFLHAVRQQRYRQMVTAYAELGGPVAAVAASFGVSKGTVNRALREVKD